MRLHQASAGGVRLPPFLPDAEQARPAITIPWEEAWPVSPDEICACSRGALVHDGYMTGALQASRGCMLRIRRLWQRHDARRLERSILLLDEAQRCHVAAWIRIELLAFEPRLKRQLIESDLPFGSILARVGIQPSFSGRRYFALPGLFAAGGGIAYRECCDRHYGRSHRMLDGEGRMLAEVCEALP
ncbi:hypothetical protein [Chromobacterium violaceum]|uniref:hypothetical protein n=1 Tax=Chromobacterium violaceum TaxID=536 RepID=UPI0006537298|nr:hypothetical protein [Chromobacterium violaceum]KMN47483.1 hypothetical protein VK93_20510 [Chromobacterium violaceum]KMN87412.1 hypothetical protein VL02_04000 [Chromobacterium violaceum]KMO03070.1 hypothetical protein VL16_14185 [Chromobacterium violaceum]